MPRAVGIFGAEVRLEPVRTATPSLYGRREDKGP
jgi:hypothetical protein